jgi:bacterioferritin-associated ferredoxin
MYICLCNAVTDSEIRRAASAGVRDLWQLQSALGVASGCGSCIEHAESILNEARAASEQGTAGQPVVYQPAPA